MSDLEPRPMSSIVKDDRELATRSELPKYGNYINGAVSPPASGAYIPTENPFLGTGWAFTARGNVDDAHRAVDAADRAFTEGEWPGLTPTQRGHLLWKFGELVSANTPRLAEIKQRDNGNLASEVT